jgi:enolase
MVNLIKDIKAYEILDSRGNPTVAAEVILDNDIKAMSFVPSGASTGKYEANEKRDHDNNRYQGKGVLKAVDSINKVIKDLLVNQDAEDISKIDSLMCKEDNTSDKSNLGANAILAVSMACTKVSAKNLRIPLHHFIAKKAEDSGMSINQSLPVPMMNILNGGAHADNPINFQEFMVQPIGFNTFSRALQCGVEIFHTLKGILKDNNMSTSVGDEGGFAPKLNSPEEALDLIIEAIEKSGYKPEDEVNLCLDVAATEFFNGNFYDVSGMNKKFSSEELINYLTSLRAKYPISSIEDGLDEDDWLGWSNLVTSIGSNTQLVGDDLFVTNASRIKKGIELNSANAVLVKLNQIGTITETLDAIKISRDNNLNTVISHRSGETEDSFIADLAVGIGSGQIKTGAPSRSDRVSKYNRLLVIEQNSDISFTGNHGF